jgi:uncharacterized DUF497 family protein
VHTLEESRGFSWDPEKARRNLRKHGVEFADAIAVFEDERAVTVRDIITAVDEQRFLTTGRDALGRILVVAYTWRGDKIRVFSARRASRIERRRYFEERR